MSCPSLKQRRHRGVDPNGARVMVVDDDPLAAEEIARTIADLGYEAFVATTWTDAVRLFGTEQLDLILMDAVMPAVDGFKLTRILRGRSHSYVPILFLTGLADESAREQGVRVGADDFLTKPVDPIELKVRMAAMLRIRQLTRALEDKTQQLARLAHLDALTGIANRRSFDLRLGDEVERAVRYSHPLALLMIDIDHFKQVNDEFGHTTGDQVLAFFGKLLTAQTRGCDLPYRYGGEEFAVLAPETESAPAVRLAERLRTAFEERSVDASMAGRITLSIGVAATDLLTSAMTPSKLLRAADEALYAAKTGGRNRTRVHGQDEGAAEPAANQDPEIDDGRAA